MEMAIIVIVPELMRLSASADEVEGDEMATTWTGWSYKV
jgi:hypothetical protein